MTFPVLIPAGPWRLHPHSFFEVLAYATGFLTYLIIRAKRGDRISDTNRWSVLTATIVGAAIGSRLLAWVDAPPPDGVLQSFGGKTIVGGLLGGWIGTGLEKVRSGIRESTGDLYVFPIIVGIAIGRVGCFLSGLPDGTYGVATTLPWGVDLGDGVVRHPTALYESVFALALGLVFLGIERRLARGQLFPAVHACVSRVPSHRGCHQTGIASGIGPHRDSVGVRGRRGVHRVAAREKRAHRRAPRSVMTDEANGPRGPTRLQGCALAMAGAILTFGGCAYAVLSDSNPLLGTALVGGGLMTVTGVAMFLIARGRAKNQD